jgi:hypothetical protein
MLPTNSHHPVAIAVVVAGEFISLLAWPLFPTPNAENHKCSSHDNVIRRHHNQIVRWISGHRDRSYAYRQLCQAFALLKASGKSSPRSCSVATRTSASKHAATTTRVNDNTSERSDRERKAIHHVAIVYRH